MPALLSNTVRSLLLLLAVWGAQALACPVCGQAKSEEVNATYVAMTAFMSLTPLALIFGVAAFVVHRIKKSEREASATASAEGDPR
ncbi:MAG: hypothetical protein M3Y59_17540 [Myxococcota bacterium]|nr:hypothetical protein [Myxococcota bacterium]